MSALNAGLTSTELSWINHWSKTTGCVHIGRFGLEGKSSQWIHLLATKGEYSHLCKPGEVVFRYVSEGTIAGGYCPLIKINVLRKLVYFLTPESFQGLTDDIAFERKALKADWIIVELADGNLQHY